MTIFPTLKKPFCWSPWCIRFQHCKGPWPQRTMTAKHNDGKAQWLQRTMTAKRNDRKERWLQENNDCNKAMTAKNRPLQRAVLEVWSLPRKLRFHIFNLQILKEVSHESFHCTTSTCRFWRKLARKLRFHIFNSQILKDARAKAFLCTTSTCRFWKGSLARKLDQGDKMRRTTDLSLANQ